MRIIGCLWVHLLISWRQGCLTKVKAFNTTIFVVHIDVCSIVTHFITVIIGRDCDLCVHTCRRCGIPVKIFLMSFGPGSNTDVLNLTTLRSLIHSYCISPVRCIDILDSSLHLGRRISELHVCSRGTNTNPRTIILNVVKVNMVLTSRVLVIARFDGYLVVPVRLASRFIPAEIILSFLIRPSWDLNSSYPFRAVYILDDDIKGTCVFVVIDNRNDSSWFIMFNIYNRFSNIMTVVIIINDIKVCTIIP